MQRGLTQQQLATLADITTARLRRLEKGDEGARLRTVGQLAGAVGDDPMDILVWEPEADAE